MASSGRRSRLHVPWEWLVPFLVAVPWIVVQGGSANLGDTQYFVVAGRTLFSAHWASTFAQPGVQAGPVEVALYGAAGRLSTLTGVGVGRLLAPVVELGVVALAIAVVGVLLEDEPMRRAVQAAVGTLVVLSGVPSLVFTGGHPADAVIPLLWLLAGREARRGNDLHAALIIGLSASIEIWSVLGAPVLLLAPRLRRLPVAGAVLVAAALIPFLPFAVAGSVRMFDYRWAVSRGSLVSVVLTPGSAFPWTLRLLQGACVLAAGILLALLTRRRAYGVFAVPLAIVGVRLLLDPEFGFGYYFAAWIILALVAAGCASCSLRPRLRGADRRGLRAAAADA
jgi:hypothetical protein